MLLGGGSSCRGQVHRLLLAWAVDRGLLLLPATQWVGPVADAASGVFSRARRTLTPRVFAACVLLGRGSQGSRSLPVPRMRWGTPNEHRHPPKTDPKRIATTSPGGAAAAWCVLRRLLSRGGASSIQRLQLAAPASQPQLQTRGASRAYAYWVPDAQRMQDVALVRVWDGAPLRLKRGGLHCPHAIQWW